MRELKRIATLAALLLCAVGQSLDVSAKSAIVVDGATGRMLWSKDPDTQRYPASLTKIMTALLLLERCTPDEMITAPPGVDKIEESSLHLVPGEQVSAGELLYALMLRSANDACVAIANHISGSVPEFAKLMNERARQIGATRTTFNNPNGLNDAKHKTTARDLSLIAVEAMKRPEFREAVRTQKRTIVRSVKQDDVELVNKNKYLTIDPGADGIKTGWTIPAGKCYVGSVTRNGFRIITVLLASDDWVKDNKALMEWAFKEHDAVKLGSAGQPLGTVEVKGGAAPKVEVGLKDTVTWVLAKGEVAPRATLVLDPDLRAPVAAGMVVGAAVYQDGSGFVQRSPVVALAAVSERSGAGLGSAIWGAGLVAGAYVLRRRARA